MKELWDRQWREHQEMLSNGRRMWAEHMESLTRTAREREELGEAEPVVWVFKADQGGEFTALQLRDWMAEMRGTHETVPTGRHAAAAERAGPHRRPCRHQPAVGPVVCAHRGVPEPAA